MRKRQLAILSAVLYLIIVGQAAAQQKKEGPNPAELAMLPQYCQDRLLVNRERMQHWDRVMGRGNSLHLHHHCNGLLYFHRANMMIGNEAQRRRLLKRAAGESNYVLKRWSPNFPLYQEALNNKMQAEALLGR